MTHEIPKTGVPDWGPFKIWRIPDPAPWWKIIDTFDTSQLKEIAAIQLDFQIEAARLELKHLEAMKKFVGR